MKTLDDVQVGWLWGVAVGISMSIAGCGSGATDMGTDPLGNPRLAIDDPESTRASSVTSSSIDPNRASIARTSLNVPQGPRDPRPVTKEGCDACQGLWAAHGIEAEETCICKTNDQGIECLDGKDCEGDCLLDGDAEFHVMDQGNPPRGYYKGHCAAYDTTFGCFRRIPDDIQGQLPLTSDEAGEDICVD